MNKEKRIKLMMMSMLFLIIFLSGAVTIYNEYKIVKKHFIKSIDTLDHHIHYSYNSMLKQMTYDMSTKADFVLNPKVKEAFFHKDRATLLRLVTPFYQRMNKLNHLKIMTFRLVDGSAFARIHKPSMFGDPLLENRKIIKDANRLQKRLYGFEVGKLKMTYRVVTPIFYEDRYIGLVEMGIEPEHMITQMQEQFQVKSALFLKSEEDDTFVFARGDDLFLAYLQAIDFQRPVTITTDDDHEYILDPELDLFDHKGKVAAKLLVGYNIDTYAQELTSAIQDIVLNVVLLFFVTFLVMNYFIQYFINRLHLLNHQLSVKKDELVTINKTLEHRVEEEVAKNRELDKRMLTQSRMAQMGEMISMIAHQWRQPLGSISSSAANVRIKLELNTHDLALEDDRVAHKDQLKSSLIAIESYVQNLSRTIDDFRNFYKPNKESVLTLIERPLQKALFIIKDSLEADGIELVQTYDSQKQMNLYENEIMQVVLSLLHNCQDNFKERGTENPRITIGTYDTDDGVCFEVCDNGGGIDPEILPRIFDPYFSTKNEKNGTGLGLYMSKTILAEHHHGDISAYNTDHGVCMKIKIGMISYRSHGDKKS